jgi:hypothetical protein
VYVEVGTLLLFHRRAKGAAVEAHDGALGGEYVVRRRGGVVRLHVDLECPHCAARLLHRETVALPSRVDRLVALVHYDLDATLF